MFNVSEKQMMQQKAAEEIPAKCFVCWQRVQDVQFDENCPGRKPLGVCSAQTCRMHFQYACGFVHGFMIGQVLCRLLDRLVGKEKQEDSWKPHGSAQMGMSPVVLLHEKGSIKTETSFVALTSDDPLDNGLPLPVIFGEQPAEAHESETSSEEAVQHQKTPFSSGPDVDLTEPHKSSVSAKHCTAQPKPIPMDTTCAESSSGDMSDAPKLCKRRLQHTRKTKAFASVSETKQRVHKLPHRKTRNSDSVTVNPLEDEMNTDITERSSQRQKKRPKKRSEKSFECEICFKTVQGKRNLIHHVKRIHSGEEPVECDICGRLCKSSVSLADHKKRIHVSSSKMCYICGAQLRSVYGLKIHLATHEGIKSHFCDVCGAGFVRQSSLRYHRKLHTEVRAFLCDLCSTSFKTAEGLNGHLLYKHRSGPYFDNRVRSLEKMGINIDKAAVRRHINHQCIECGENLDSGKCPTHPDIAQEVFQCSECGQAKKDIVEFHLHMRHHRGEKIPHRPSMKGRRVQRVQPVQQNTVSGFQCKICSMSFATSTKMYNHRRLHQDKIYTCHLCGFKTRYKSNLNTHIRTHNDARPFQCDICQKTFKHKQLLKDHKNLHGGDAAQHKCEICGKGLTRRENLRNHYKIMHPEAKQNDA
ncbi:hypothetical protein BaRGS_00002899 [Batillaria attramentaria]|uniref:C2H2-type domain-containing protein n=1 Tax=Batillaria attramentaria TaxID=370345 RepID=A0ABD0M1R7_9CAEN